MTVENIFGAEGRIARAMEGFELRPQQTQMAAAVQEAFAAAEHLLIEAGTGVGKSFAYLVPAIDHVFRNGGVVVISTHTIALQEQLVEKDIPFLRKVMPQDFRAVLVKGRSNYLGIRRLTRTSARLHTLLATTAMENQLHMIENWAYRTQDGSLSDLPQQPDPAVWESVRSESDDCMGRKCRYFKKCFYQRARRQVDEAQILIVNHALLFSDLAVRMKGAPEGAILPNYEFLILDEAHTVERVAADHLGLGVSDVQARYLLNRLYNEKTRRGVLAGDDSAHLRQQVSDTRHLADAYFDSVTRHVEARAGANGRVSEPLDLDEPLSEAMEALSKSLEEGVSSKRQGEEARMERSALANRCCALGKSVRLWHRQGLEDGWVYWVQRGERRRRLDLCAQPLDVGPMLQRELFSKVRSAVLTSATLTTASSQPFDYLCGRLGFESPRTMVLGSPFDYASQLKIYVEPDMPDPAEGEAYLSACCTAIERHVRRTDGHAFVLFTSYDMLNRCAGRMAGFFEGEQMPLFVQGSGLPRTAMLDRFRSQPRSVLFGTDTFWTGVDVPGDALQLVIIARLPFAAPNDPMTQARIEKMRAEKANPFMAFQVPEAVLKFRQGVGRLIRSTGDRGNIVILDPRLVRKPYGKFFLDALPPGEVVSDSAGFRAGD